MSLGCLLVPSLFATRVNVDTAVAYCSKSNGSPCSARELRSFSTQQTPAYASITALDYAQAISTAEVSGYAVDNENRIHARFWFCHPSYRE